MFLATTLGIFAMDTAFLSLQHAVLDIYDVVYYDKNVYEVQTVFEIKLCITCSISAF